ncbi:MAG TPA: aminomethyl-transferring glycine dehydrogenase [Candidatus Krumholzibacteria bacterium]|nr:aminomethyl-transferring glycine dehydrogenase [Candidatus Krumholzibacteria bacterium]
MSRAHVSHSGGDLLRPTDSFVPRHLGPSDSDTEAMLAALGIASIDDLIDETVPAGIRLPERLALDGPRTESEALAEIRGIAAGNRVMRSFIGMGYHDTLTPAVIQRNVLENPGWYTQYTPYQAEISQGRLEALLNFQTMVSDLCALPLSNASLLDEATAAAEAMGMCWSVGRQKRHRFFVSDDCHPQTIAVVETRATPLGIDVVVGDLEDFDPSGEDYFGVLASYPTTDGRVVDLAGVAERAHAHGTRVVVAADLLALTLLRAPGEFGADIAIGSSQRFGVPLGFGGPHAAFMAAADDFKRLMPGRIIGVSKDSAGKPALRLAMQTREQHIRRDKATSNICTAQVLLAVMASMYGVYHGPDGLRRIAARVHGLAELVRTAARRLGHEVADGPIFDTVRITPQGIDATAVRYAAEQRGLNFRWFDDGSVGIALDEPTTAEEVTAILESLTPADTETPEVEPLAAEASTEVDPAFARTSDYMTHPVFHENRSEHQMLRYLHKLQSRDLSLVHSMIPLGSCTMKLNASAEMAPVTWNEFGRLHPFAPENQTEGYRELFRQMESTLGEITGYDAVSLQPNAGAQGEYTGLLVIRAYHHARGDHDRDVCLIPVSAHGTNPASAVMAGMKVVSVDCDDAGNIDLDDLKAKAEKHADRLSALMITYPSTHGVFEETVREVCDTVHAHGGQVYMDGANMNAQVGVTTPGSMGADVCHLNLHKTFCIPHGGGGPGMGPIGVKAHLAPFLPGHPVVETGGEQAIGPVSAAPWGSPSILPISWMYMRMMGEEGLRRATGMAVLNANYMAHRLRDHYPILYSGRNGRVAHEFILDVRAFKDSAGVTVDDIAKRLVDYGFHAPTMSWPVAGTLMVEPTESESKDELDRFCEAMIAIREEIRAIEDGTADGDDNVLHNAPHTLAELTRDDWPHPYSREQAGWPKPWLRDAKFFPSVGRVDNAWGDRHLVCTCPPVEEMAEV